MNNKIAWGITGAGHYLTEVVQLLSEFNTDIFLSKAAQEVLAMYKINIHQLADSIYNDNSASSPLIGRLYKNYYKLLIIAPVTSNTIAKCSMGIADNLITNLFAHAGKCKVPTIILPTDFSRETISSPSPRGQVTLYPRKIDLDNLDKIRQMDDVFIATNVEELTKWVKQYL